ncbi:hypothetical protein [Lactiplantibacillus plantarum]|uniref:hypothetical protein n=1 Tax=Lactiplantibacillus plantarum TaxID=1590 RepID=UPI001E41A4B0|nr:hypothetical protein [Lactiplantibacillus plantarum]
MTSNGLYPDGYYYALTDTAFYGVVKPTDPSVKLDAPFLNGSTWFYFFDGGLTIYSYQNNVWTGHTFLNAAADNAAADKAAADKAAADKAAADKAAADKAAADKAAADKAAAEQAAADESSAPLNMNLEASGMDTVGKYAKRLYILLTGADGRPRTVTGIKVSEGNGLTTSYTEEQLQGMGLNVNLTADKVLTAYLPSRVGTQGWDTSNLTVNVDVKLENGPTTTLTDKIIPSPSNEDYSIR